MMAKDHRLHEEPDSVVHHPLCEEHFPNGQSELPLIQLKSVSLHPITGHEREISTFPSAATLEVDLKADRLLFSRHTLIV